MPLRAIPAPVWFAAALAPMLASQIIRLPQHDVELDLWDYAGRLSGLFILASIPSARSVAFGPDKLRMSGWTLTLWIVGIALADRYPIDWVRRTISAALPATALGSYPQASGWLHLFDVVFGLALVACSEEIAFRRCARHVFQAYLGDGSLMVVSSSLLFGAYHWWAGAGNIVGAMLTGALLMLFFRRSGALWPVALAHYLIDVIFFA